MRRGRYSEFVHKFIRERPGIEQDALRVGGEDLEGDHRREASWQRVHPGPSSTIEGSGDHVTPFTLRVGGAYAAVGIMRVMVKEPLNGSVIPSDNIKV